VLSAPRQKAETPITINFAITEPQKKQEVLTYKSKDSALGIRQKAEASIIIKFAITVTPTLIAVSG
tara:strand:+ start:28342 stop:28539 length:198 start_codon:yes stop_codon:yes gene_type:complete